MIIAIDFDGTYSADPTLWDAFITSAKSRGHKVYCVTARRETEENVAECDVPGVLTYFTGLSAKDWYMREKRGIVVDVWVDDDPKVIVHGH